MVEGLAAPRGQIWPVPEWDELRVSHRFCPPELDLWVSSLLLLTIYPERKKKEAERKWPRNNPPPPPPPVALNPSSWVIALSAASSLLIHTHCTASLICQSEKVAPWHSPGSSQLLGQYFSSGGGRQMTPGSLTLSRLLARGDNGGI